MIETPLFQAEHIILTAVNAEEDAPVISHWSHNPDVARRLQDKPFKPMSTQEAKKFFEEREKEADEKRSSFNFAVRMKTDRRMVGFLRIMSSGWTNQTGRLEAAIGDQDVRGSAEREMYTLALNYIFTELNLHRLTVNVPAYDYTTTAICEELGFTLEVTQREKVYHAGRYWDDLKYGILAREWLQENEE
jgi:RimJ/RimL family protein N-acetyltransferase